MVIAKLYSKYKYPPPPFFKNALEWSTCLLSGIDWSQENTGSRGLRCTGNLWAWIPGSFPRTYKKKKKKNHTQAGKQKDIFKSHKGALKVFTHLFKVSNRIPRSFIVQKRKQLMWGWKPYSTQMLISISTGTRTQISISRPQPLRHHVCWDVWLEKSIYFLRELFYLWDNQIGGTVRFFIMEFYY